MAGNDDLPSLELCHVLVFVGVESGMGTVQLMPVISAVATGNVDGPVFGTRIALRGRGCHLGDQSMRSSIGVSWTTRCGPCGVQGEMLTVVEIARVLRLFVLFGRPAFPVLIHTMQPNRFGNLKQMLVFSITTLL